MATRGGAAWARAFDVRPWEWSRLLAICLLWGVLTWGQSLGANALQSLFLFGSGVAQLPLVFVLYAALMVPTAVAYTLALERLGIDRLFYLLLAVLIVAALGMRALLAAAGPSAGLLFGAYLADQVLLNLGMLQFWNYASRLFDTQEAKRLFPLVGAASSLGLLASGCTAAVLAGPLGTSNLLLVWALLVGVAAVIFHRCQSRLGAGVAATSAEAAATPAGLRQLVRHPLLRGLLGASLLLTILLYLLDYEVADVYTHTFPNPDALTAFLGGLMSGLSLLGLALSAWLVPRLMTRLGVRQVAMVVPLLTTVSAAGLTAFYQLPSAILAATTRYAVVGAFDDPVQNLLLALAGPRLEGRARALLRGMVVPLAVASAGLLLLAARGRLTTMQLGLLTLAVAAAYLLVSWGLRQTYVRALVARVREGRLSLDELPPGAVRLGRAEVQELAGVLVDADPDTRAFVVDALGRLGDHVGLPVLAERLADPAPVVRAAALRAIATIGDPATLPTVLPLLADEAPAVRAAAIGAATTLDGPRGAAAAVPSLEDTAGEVRVAAARAIAEWGAPAERPRAVAALEALVRAGAPPERARAIRSLSALGVPLHAGTRAALLAADAVEVRLAAVTAEPLAEEEQALLVVGLADPAARVRRAAADRLVAGGEAACLSLVARFPDLPGARAALALACLARSGGPGLREEVDYRVAAELARAACDAPLRRALAAPQAPPGGAVLAIALEHAHRRAMRHALAVGTARLSERIARELSAALAGTDSRRRADAQELLLNLVPPRCGQALGPLLEAPAMDAPVALEADRLAEYLTHPDPWVRAGALYAIGHRAAGEPRRRLSAVDAETPLLAALVAETQARLGPTGEPGPSGGLADSSPAGETGTTTARGGHRRWKERTPCWINCSPCTGCRSSAT